MYWPIEVILNQRLKRSTNRLLFCGQVTVQIYICNEFILIMFNTLLAIIAKYKVLITEWGGLYLYINKTSL